MSDNMKDPTAGRVMQPQSQTLCDSDLPNRRLTKSIQAIRNLQRNAMHSHDNAIAAKEYEEAASFRKEHDDHDAACRILEAMLWVIE